MKVSTHLAGKKYPGQQCNLYIPETWRPTDYRLLELATVIQFEQLSRTQSEHHTLVVFLEMIIDLCGDQGGKTTFGEGFIFVESLSEDTLVMDR